MRRPDRWGRAHTAGASGPTRGDFRGVLEPVKASLAALGGCDRVTTFGDPAITRQPLTEILLP